MIKAYFKVLNLAGPVNSKMNDITFFADGSMAVYVMTKLRLMLRLMLRLLLRLTFVLMQQN